MRARRRTVTIGTTPIEIAGTAYSARNLVITNVGTVTVYITDQDDTVQETSFPLGAGLTLETDFQYKQKAFTATGTGTLGIWDESE